jgi:hypothetical protein
MPENVSKGFFDTMFIDMHEREDLNLFKKQSGSLSMSPYTSIESIRRLACITKTGTYIGQRDSSDCNEKAALENQSYAEKISSKILSTNSKLNKPLSFFILLLPLNSKNGDKKSTDFLSELISQGGNSNFESLTIQGLLDFKLTKMMPIAMVQLFLYCLYLLLMNLFDFTGTILVFFVY